MEATLPANVTNHYRRNRDTYDRISTRLFDTRRRLLESSRKEQIEMLQKSHSFAVISVQTPVHIHERAWTNMWSDGKPSDDLETALESVNYKYNKIEYIKHSLDNPEMWVDVIEMLESGDVDKAHKYILDNFKGVGPAKAPFTLSMLGFQEKMCVDTNMVNAFDLDGHVSTVVVEKYDAICDKIRDKMPTMRDMTTPFMFQWVTFDYQRGNVSTHDTFYELL